ncbi:MAG: DNA polymerase III subunit epsilon, partial [Pusillimonas sp.]|nr:DNA polymerase III subunit epsilon [Pusillimonas sp.]
DFLSSYPRFHEVADQLMEYVRGAEVIIHNATFDVKFLDAELERAGRPRFSTLCEKITDSLLYARELHPGKRNSLDALCERYGISNAHRTLHGALLDSELLADVWLSMTRGQDSLLMDLDDESAAGAGPVGEASFNTSRLKVLRASPGEAMLHQAYLEALDKSSGGNCVWRKYEGDETPGGH